MYMSLLPDDIPLRLRAVHGVFCAILLSRDESGLMSTTLDGPFTVADDWSWAFHPMHYSLTSVNPVDKVGWAKVVEAWKNFLASIVGHQLSGPDYNKSLSQYLCMITKFVFPHQK